MKPRFHYLTGELHSDAAYETIEIVPISRSDKSCAVVYLRTGNNVITQLTRRVTKAVFQQKFTRSSWNPTRESPKRACNVTLSEVQPFAKSLERKHAFSQPYMVTKVPSYPIHTAVAAGEGRTTAQRAPLPYKHEILGACGL